MKIVSIFILLVFFIISSCKPEEENFFELNQYEQGLVNTIIEKSAPLSNSPLEWQDDDLVFMDQIAQADIIGMGEATHGTAEFFNSKYRVFKYLVEKHDYKVFAIEADFGESLYINEAIANGDKAALRELMKTKMHFWTWRTEEVLEMLTWMAEYNVGKSEEQKIKYVGVDCQFNTFHPGLIKEKLNGIDTIIDEADLSIFDDIRRVDESFYENLTIEDFNSLEERTINFQKIFNDKREAIVEIKGEKEFDLIDQLITVMKQVIQVNKNRNYFTSRDIRDISMGQNTKWAYEHYDKSKTLVWAHNVHIEVRKPNGTVAQGNFLDRDYMKYTTIGFSFSRGSFTAFEFEYDEETGLSVGELKEHSILTSPVKGSLNHFFYSAKIPVFYINMDDLRGNKEWFLKLSNEIDHLSIGSSFNGNPRDFYYEISDTNYDHMIYFDEKTTATKLIER